MYFLHFLVAGNTKNCCDSSFRRVERSVKRSNVHSELDRMKVIDEISVSNYHGCGNSIRWIDW